MRNPGVTPPFGTVTLTQNGANTVHIVLSLASPDLKFVSTGASDAFGFNIIGSPTISVANITSGFSLVSNTAGSLHDDGFGNFLYGIALLRVREWREQPGRRAAHVRRDRGRVDAIGFPDAVLGRQPVGLLCGRPH